MSNLKLLRTILRLKRLQITHFRFLHRDTELHLAVKPYKNGCRCPTCGRRGRIVHQPTELRRWEDVAHGPARRALVCPEGDPVPDPRARAGGDPLGAGLCPRHLPAGVAPLCPVSDHDPEGCGRDFAVPTSTLSNLLHRVITRVRHGHTIRGLTTLGVDEISYCKGRKFATLVYDLDRAQVLWVGQGKGRDTIDRFFNDWLSRGQKARLAWASCDISPAYIGAITHHCPNVRLVIDRFHLVKALNQAVDEVRKEQWRALDTQGRKAIKGLRWLLSRHSRHRTKGHTRFLNSLRNSNRRIHRAWVLKDEFEQFWDYRYPAAAKKFLRRWMTAALRSRIPTLRTFVGTLRTHLVHIMAFIDRPLTNAVGEGLNRLIKIVKNRASGYRHLDCFADMIYLTVGDLDIPAHIPSQLRTL